MLLESSTKAIDQGVDNLEPVSGAAAVHTDTIVGHATFGLSSTCSEFDSNDSSTFIECVTNNVGD
jgi:hypothetical protein